MADVDAPRPLWRRALWFGCAPILLIAGSKLLLAVLGTWWGMRGVWRATEWPVLLNVALFGGAGVVLVAGSAGDRRVRALGALFLIIASAFANPLMPAAGSPFDVAVEILSPCRADAFLAAALWWFVWTFPQVPAQERTRRTGRVFLTLSAAIGVLLFVANILPRAADSHAYALRLGEALDRASPTFLYWILLFGAAAPAIPYLVWKSRLASAEERRRVAFFVAALTAGLSPMLIAVLLSPAIPALNTPEWRERTGLLLYATLASTVPTTMYAVAVKHVMTIRLVVQKTLQHALARTTVWIASFGPLAWLAVDVYLHRGETVAAYLIGNRATRPLVLSLVGFTALTFRHHLLMRVDRWFSRESIDYTEALARLERGCRMTRSVRELAALLQKDLERAIQAHGVAVLVVREGGDVLVPLAGTAESLNADSALLDLLRSTRSEIEIGVSAADQVLAVLPESDQRWLANGGIQLLSPLVGSTGALLGVVAIGKHRSGLPYDRRHRMLVTAVSGLAAMQLENRWLRAVQSPHHEAAGANRDQPIDWGNEPAACCPACGVLWPPATITCACGAATTLAALPLLVRGTFRVERLLGAGGMGVVYLALDLELNRRVAIKTLPTLTEAHAARLKREARAMASVLHPNLATIYATEQWRGTPLLIVEYLEGGTLAEWLRRGRVSVEEALDLGIILADVLDRVHATGILHRDIKPSNIGYTGAGVPKLLDFGLAAIVDAAEDAELSLPSAWSTLPDDVADRLRVTPFHATMTTTQQLIGTPLYLSPEALAGHSPQPSFDLWSLAMVLHEALAGRHPLGRLTVSEVVRTIQRHPIPDIRDIRPDCPAIVAAFFNDALSPVAARRPPSAGDLRRGLQSLRVALASGQR